LIKPNILLVGAGGHARSCIDVIEQQGNFSIAGLIEFSKQTSSKNLNKPYSVIGTDDDEFEIKAGISKEFAKKIIKEAREVDSGEEEDKENFENFVSETDL
jgi:FlaA1/EpsC-like NDP-sugar epimerase